VQQHYGFRPLFIATSILYGVASLLTWAFFRHTEGLPELPQQIILQSPEYPE
jgi:hypothetical protein